ncbi:MAG: TIGR02300 family protein [Rhodobacteraceae bacterium]|jgi:uncharacterized protein (TIGR02300 family)|nr:TIGR02300 family protein [Paracoccaceae bacterium]MBL4558682.1 TIGR02300 family protein [Paracoccaceae bacterium]
MPKEEWGTKRVCPNCETRFYDLRRDPMVCPACGHSFDLASLQGGKNQSVPPTKQKSPASPAVAADDDSAEVIEDDADVDLDDDVLEDDPDGDSTVDIDEIADVAAEDDDDS